MSERGCCDKDELQASNKTKPKPKVSLCIPGIISDSPLRATRTKNGGYRKVGPRSCRNGTFGRLDNRGLGLGMAHPYVELEGTPLWTAVEAAINDLVVNHDLIEQTARTHIVGYISRAVANESETIAAQLKTP